MIDNEKRIINTMKASPEKRFHSFVSSACDGEEVWLLESENGYFTVNQDGYTCLPVWPEKEFALAFCDKARPVCMDVHDFCDMCRDLSDNHDMRFMVFPTKENSFIIGIRELLDCMLEELDRIE